MAIPYKALLDPPYNLTCQKEREKTRFPGSLWRAPKCYLWLCFAEPRPMPLALDSLSSLRSPHPHSYPFTLLAWVSLFLFWTLHHPVSPESLPSIKAMDPILALVKFSEKLDKLFRQWKWQCEAVPLSLQPFKAIQPFYNKQKIWIKDVFWSKD